MRTLVEMKPIVLLNWYFYPEVMKAQCLVNGGWASLYETPMGWQISAYNIPDIYLQQLGSWISNWLKGDLK
jgi:hypothetical protein